MWSAFHLRQLTFYHAVGFVESNPKYVFCSKVIGVIQELDLFNMSHTELQESFEKVECYCATEHNDGATAWKSKAVYSVRQSRDIAYKSSGNPRPPNTRMQLTAFSTR